MYFRRASLAGSTKFPNRRPIFTEERLPKFDRNIQNAASGFNLVITTRNSEVRVFVKKPNKHVHSIGIKRPQMLSDLAPHAVQLGKQHADRTKRTFGIGSEVEDIQTPMTKKAKTPQIQMVKR